MTSRQAAIAKGLRDVDCPSLCRCGNVDPADLAPLVERMVEAAMQAVEPNWSNDPGWDAALAVLTEQQEGE